jgi:hypothetical protein
MNENKRVPIQSHSNKYDALIELCRSAERIVIMLINKKIK